MKTLISACMALLLLSACGQKDALYAPGEGPKNTRYIIQGSDTPAGPPAKADAPKAAPPQTAAPKADRHE